MRVLPIQMVDAVIYYNAMHIKVDVINCILPLKNTLKAFKRQAFIHSLRYICSFFFFISIFQSIHWHCFLFTFNVFFSRQNISDLMTRCLYFLFFILLFFLLRADNIWLLGPKWSLSYTIATKSIRLYDI